MAHSTIPAPAAMPFTLLPSIVKSIQLRLSALPLIRPLSANVPHELAHHLRTSNSVTEPTPPRTPPPRYTSRRPSVHSVLSREVEVADGLEGNLHADALDFTREFASCTPRETESGIGWKHASRGLRLLDESSQEAGVLAQNLDESSTELTRQLYVNGLCYVIRGLPKCLTPKELSQIRAAIAVASVELQDRPAKDALVVSHRRCAKVPSVLHCLTAAIVLRLILFLSFVYPYVRMLVGYLCQLERDHKLLRRGLRKSAQTAEGVRQSASGLARTVCQMNDGRVGAAISDSMFWCAQELSRGLQQGFEDGLTEVSQDRKIKGTASRSALS